MKKNCKKPFLWAGIYSAALTGFTAFVILDTFVLPQEQKKVTNSSIYAKTSSTSAISSESISSETSQSNSSYNSNSTDSSSGSNEQLVSASSDSTSSSSSSSSSQSSDSQSSSAITANSYSDDNISIQISSVRENDTNIYVADVQVKSIQYLKTAFADNSYGRNIKETTSDIAQSSGAIFAINGDFYGFRDYGFVLRNGTLYRDTAGDGDALVIYSDGSFKSVSEADSNAQQLLDDGAVQILSFGPALIKDGSITVGSNDEVGQSMTSNPRTAIGMISPLHYIFVVSDGRTNENAGLSLKQLADVMQEYGCTEAYNLDGGGSSTMWFNGNVINSPTDGKSSGERKVSDIVCIGY